jgi:alpha-beta hydrolase superfamily lysophospholipase
MTIDNPRSEKCAQATVWPPVEEESVQGARGGRLFVRRAVPEGRVRAWVLLTHGLGEHSGRYGHVAEALIAREFAVVGWDLRGHGRSSGERGDILDGDCLVDDLAAVCAHFRRDDVPLFFFAHSLGGQIALRLLEKDPAICRGAVVLSPWLRLAFNPPVWKLALAQVMMKVWPGFPQQTSKRKERLSRDPEHLGSFPDLDLVHHRISARMYFACRTAAERVMAGAGRLRTPLLLLHGDDDPVTSHHATCEFFEKAGSTDKTLRIFPANRHETHNDLDRERVIREAGEWMERRIANDE